MASSTDPITASLDGAIIFSEAFSTVTSSEINYESSFKQASDIRGAFAIITILMATVGNTLTFVLMRRKPMKTTSAGVFFSYLAMADTATVYIGQLLYLIGYVGKIYLIPHHPWSCRWVFFLLFGSADVAVWLLVAATTDRFIAIFFPMKTKEMCTPKRAHIVASSFITAAIIKNLHLFWTRGRQVIVRPDGVKEVINCGFPSPGIERFELYIRPWIGFTLYAFLPIAAIFTLNVCISYKLYRLAKFRPGGNSGSTSGKSGGGEKNTKQLTVMLLSVAIVFLFLIIPSITVLVVRPYVVHSKEDGVRMAYVEAIVDSMAYINHSTNFILYCLTGTGFRKEAKKLLCFWRSNKVGVETAGDESVTQKDL